MINNNQLRQLFQSSPVPGLLISTTTPGFTITAANDAWLTATGLSNADCAEQSIFNLPHHRLSSFYQSHTDALNLSFSTVKETGNSDTLVTHQANSLQAGWDIENIAIAGETMDAGFIYHCLVPQQYAESLQERQQWPLPEKVNHDLNKILDLSLDVMCTIDGQGVLVSVSAASGKVWGYQPAELIGKSILELIHPLDYAKTLQFGIDIMSGQGVNNIENRHLHRNGKVVFMLWSVYWDAADQLNYCVAKDTTEKNRQDAVVKVSEKKYRYLFQNNPTPMFIWDFETLLMADCNEEALLLYGYTREEFLHLNILDIRRKEDESAITDYIKNNDIVGKAYKTATRHLKKNGEVVHVNINGHIIDYNKRKAVLVQVIDTSEKQQAETLLQQKDKLYRVLVENSGTGVVILSPSGGPVYITKAIKRVMGYSEEETLQLNINDMVHPEDKHIVTEKMKESFEKEGELIKGPPLRMMHRDGSFRWLEATLLNLINEPAVQGIVCNFRDISDRVNAEEYLRRSEEKYKLLFQNSPLSKWIYDINTLQILQVNDTAINHYGYTREEFLKMTIKDLRRPEDIPKLLDAFKKIKNKTGIILFGTFTHQKKDKSLMQMEVSGHQLIFEDKDCMMVAANDVTERENALRQLKDKEAKLSTAQKIARLGYWQFDPVKSVMYWSDEVFSIWGIEKKSQEVTYDFFLQTVYKEDFGTYQKAYQNSLKTRTTLDVEYRIVLPDESVKWIHEKGTAIPGNAVSGFIFEGTIQDITERKLARENLLISEARNRGIFESQTNYVIRTDLQGNYSFCNNKFLADFGWLYPDNMMIGKSTLSSIKEYHHQRVMDTVEKCFCNLNCVIQVEIDKPGKNGDTKTTLWDFICLIDSAGQPTEMQCVGTDITARKIAENALRESNIRYEYVTKATSDAIWDWDIATSALYWGQGFQSIFGYDVDSHLPNSVVWQDHLHPEESEGVLKKLYAAINGTDTKWTDEYRYQKSNGDYAHVVDKGLIIRNEQGKAIRMVGAMQDITKQKEEERHLKLLEAVVTNTSDSVIIAEVEPADIPCPVIVYVNNAFTKMTGFAAAEALGRSPRFLQGNNTSKDDINSIIESFKTGKPCEVTAVGYKKNGEEFWVHSSMSKMENVPGIKSHWIAVQRDITQKKLADLELEKVYEERNTILESIGDGFFNVDKNWTVTYWNNQAAKMVLIPKTAIVNKNLWAAYPQLNAAIFIDNFNGAMNENCSRQFETFSDRLNAWFEVSAYPSANGLSVYFKDISARKSADQQIKSERNLLKILIDNLPDAIYFKDNNARKLISNKPDYELLGAANEEDVVGKTDLDMLPYDEGIVGYTHDMKILKSGESLIDFEQYFTPKQGSPIWLRTTKLALRNEQNNIVGLLGIGRNITKEKITEQNLLVLNKELSRHVKQLAASNAELEQFAYIASHDLQEPLRMVTSFLSQIELKYNPLLDDTGKKFIHFAVDGARRMRQIILDLLQFSRIGREEDKIEAVDMKALAEDVLVLCSKQIEEARAVITIDPLPTLVIPASPFRQVFQNLISNSLKYYDHTKEEPLRMHLFAIEYPQYWEFGVEDNGIGIDPIFFDKIFIIFQRLHNQKEYSGTGIGLAITKKIIENYGGKMRVESEEGKGSTFYFSIPK